MDYTFREDLADNAKKNNKDINAKRAIEADYLLDFLE